MNKKYLKIGVLAASVLMIVSTILPYVSVLGYYTLTLLMGDGSQMADGIFFVALAVLCIVFVLMDKAIPLMAASVFSVIVWIYEITQLSQFGALVTKGIGYWLLAISAIVLLVLSILYFVLGKKGSSNTPDM